MSSDTVSLILLVLFPVSAAILGFGLARVGWWPVACVLAALLVLGGVYLMVESRQAEGWDRLGLYVIGIGFLLPAAVGVGLGACLGQWLRRR
jgi:O-antigen ligase